MADQAVRHILRSVLLLVRAHPRPFGPASGIPEVVVTEITHHGQSAITGAPYRFIALGVIRVRDGEIVRYDDYMDPIAVARLLGRTRELATALSTT